MRKSLKKWKIIEREKALGMQGFFYCGRKIGCVCLLRQDGGNTKAALCFPEKNSFVKCFDIIDFFGNISDYYMKKCQNFLVMQVHL